MVKNQLCVASRRQRQSRIGFSGHPSILVPGITSLNGIKLWGVHFTLYTSEWKHLISELTDFSLQDVDIRNCMKKKKIEMMLRIISTSELV